MVLFYLAINPPPPPPSSRISRTGWGVDIRRKMDGEDNALVKLRPLACTAGHIGTRYRTETSLTEDALLKYTLA